MLINNITDILLMLINRITYKIPRLNNNITDILLTCKTTEQT